MYEVQEGQRFEPRDRLYGGRFKGVGIDFWGHFLEPHHFFCVSNRVWVLGCWVI